MQITSLKQKGKSEEYYVEIDGEKHGTLMLEVIVKNHLKVGSELSHDEYLAIKEQSNQITCFSRALAYISSRLKTEKQMQDYLLQKGYSYNCTQNAIQKLKNYGYLNDEYYAKLYTETASQSKGKRYIKQQLYVKGVNEQIASNILLDVNDDEACVKVCQKWLKGKVVPLCQKDKEKLYRFLLSRGFEYETIKHAIYSATNEDV